MIRQFQMTGGLPEVQVRSQKFTAEGANLGNGGHKNEYSEREQLWLT
jgi:hypothetical protein